MWARRSNFAQAIERACVHQGEEISVEWEPHDQRFACSFVVIDKLTYAAYHLMPMMWFEIEEFHDAQLAARAARNLPFACPDLDQDYLLEG